MVSYTQATTLTSWLPFQTRKICANSFLLPVALSCFKENSPIQFSLLESLLDLQSRLKWHLLLEASCPSQVCNTKNLPHRPSSLPSRMEIACFLSRGRTSTAPGTQMYSGNICLINVVSEYQCILQTMHEVQGNQRQINQSIYLGIFI